MHGSDRDWFWLLSISHEKTGSYDHYLVMGMLLDIYKITKLWAQLQIKNKKMLPNINQNILFYIWSCAHNLAKF